ncbi:MAG: hypothetical protein KKD01_15605 [Proteobacteria bacterium]|nr:hypothetical protein [Pseudomonadota bacterium]MBU1139507.1 hypothetical protein [Pseudomonadota bacterium]MBU1231655.1 hypothetical protein [Pseudomonadota bacterium]MBU1417665.1 hypothetical protein [Pseudomonadota bacterium]MBU1456150.1 hypothetical protein [Pseudomonadota bacterium]
MKSYYSVALGACRVGSIVSTMIFFAVPMKKIATSLLASIVSVMARTYGIRHISIMRQSSLLPKKVC